MGSYRTVLIGLALLACLTRIASAAGTVRCLACHRAHYGPRGSCMGCHRGNDKSDRPLIAHHNLIPARFAYFSIEGTLPVERGRRLMETFACRRCHSSGGRGNRLATNLDRLPDSVTPAAILDSIGTPARSMPAFAFSEQQMIDLVNAILAGWKNGVKGKGEAPLVVHFERDGQTAENVFDRLCGACHRALTEEGGALGRGDAGPNLSGLFSGFYPRTFGNGRSWRPQDLDKWLENPRKIRWNALMRPVRLKPEERGPLLRTLFMESGAGR